MSFKDFKVLETLGKGSFACVYKVLRKSDNKIYALKRVKINKMSKKEIADALNEIRFLASIRHKNIVGFLEAFLENNETELCIIMEFCGCGDLNQKVERYKRRRQYIDEDVIWRYLIQCLKALQCLHASGICHRDLKNANTFIAEDGSVKIGDMNVSKRLKENGLLQTQIGTPYYMSPEIWNNHPYDSSSDMWSLGCMIYELTSLRPPFLADTFPALKRVVTAGRYLPIPRKYSSALGKVIAQMLRVNPRERPSAEKILRSEELSGKLQLDELAVQAHQRAQEASAAARMSLMETIKVPQNLRRISLPKPCYPDIRPNSPTAWTVAEQMQMQQQRQAQVAKAAAVAQLAPPPVPPSTKPVPSAPIVYAPGPETNDENSQSSANSVRTAPSAAAVGVVKETHGVAFRQQPVASVPVSVSAPAPSYVPPAYAVPIVPPPVPRASLAHAHGYAPGAIPGAAGLFGRPPQHYAVPSQVPTGPVAAVPPAAAANKMKNHFIRPQYQGHHRIW